MHVSYGGIPATRYSRVIVSTVAGPLLVSLFLIGFGLWIASRNWPIVSPWRCVGWCTVGLAAGVVLSLGLMWHQSAVGNAIADPEFVLATFATHGSAGGALVGYYDIRVRESNVFLQQKTQQLTEFASIVSHDLRNPLQAARGHLDLLAAEVGDDSAHLAPIRRAHDRMERIVDETLTLASHDQDVLSFDVVSVAAVAREAQDEIADHDWGDDRRRGATEVEITTTQYLRANRQWLRQLLGNLFRNALEHNEGPVTVAVGDLSDGFYVEDTGGGIPPDLRDRVFESGFTTDESGTGLGLAIVRAIADAHGWTVTVTESADGGARIEVRNAG
jgi:signal transduction histidine kinase